MKKRLIALALLLCMLFSCALAEDARYGQVYDTAQDAGRLTVRYLWLGPQVADDKPGDCMILTSPDGKIMGAGCGSSAGDAVYHRRAGRDGRKED